MRTFFARALVASAALVSASGIAQANQLKFGAATGYNAFIFSDFTEYGTDSEGRLAIGGNFAPAGGSFTVASQHGSDPAGMYDLVVGGNMSNQYASVGGGDVFVGGNMNWTDPSLPHNAYVNGNFVNSANGGSVGGTVYHTGTYSSGTALSNVQLTSATAAPIDFLSAQTYLQSESASLAAQQANGTVSNNGYGTYTLTGTNSGLNVFNLTAGSYSGFSININAPSGSTVVVNVAGSSDSFLNGQINLNGIPANNVVFNFSSATALSLSGIGFNGSILAPFAAFTGTYGQINGQLIAMSAAGTTEFHDLLFNGTLPTPSGNSNTSPTPEPATYASLLIGLGFTAVARKKLTSQG